MSDGKNRSLSLPVDALERFKADAAARGMSVSAWLVEAGLAQHRRQMAQATAAYCAQPQIAEQVAQWVAESDRDGDDHDTRMADAA